MAISKGDDQLMSVRDLGLLRYFTFRFADFTCKFPKLATIQVVLGLFFSLEGETPGRAFSMLSSFYLNRVSEPRATFLCRQV